MFLRFNLRLKIGLIIIKVSSNYINGGTWLAAMATRSPPVQASTIDYACANYADSHQLLQLRTVCYGMRARRQRAGWLLSTPEGFACHCM